MLRGDTMHGIQKLELSRLRTHTCMPHLQRYSSIHIVIQHFICVKKLSQNRPLENLYDFIYLLCV